MAYPSMLWIAGEQTLTTSRGMASDMFSCVLAHGSQYWALTASRGASERFSPPPCHSVPRKKTTEPAGMTSEMRGSLEVGSRSSHVWLPGSTTVAPLVSVNASMAKMVAALNALRGRGIG